MVGLPIQPRHAKSATTRESALVALLWGAEGYLTHRKGSQYDSPFSFLR